MIRRLLLSVFTMLAMAGSAAPTWAADWIFTDNYLLGLGWTNKYKAMARCPGGRPHPWNPFLAVPFHSSVGQTGPRRMILWAPTLKSPLYNNTPGLVAIPPELRRTKGNCSYPYLIAPYGSAYGYGGLNGNYGDCQDCQDALTAPPPGVLVPTTVPVDAPE
jgi:hypothetical protein